MSEIILRENKGIIYELFQEKDLKETIALVAEDFSRAEPMTKSQGIIADEFRYFAEIVC